MAKRRCGSSELVAQVFGTLWMPPTIGIPGLVHRERNIGGLGCLALGSTATVVDVLEMWTHEARLDGFNLSHATTSGTFDYAVGL